jgi:hypothetical protein
MPSNCADMRVRDSKTLQRHRELERVLRVAAAGTMTSAYVLSDLQFWSGTEIILRKMTLSC